MNRKFKKSILMLLVFSAFLLTLWLIMGVKRTDVYENTATSDVSAVAESGFLTSDTFRDGKDRYSCKSINILGDSISHGANAPNIAKDSYVALLKQSIAKKYGGFNYGYTNLYFSFGSGVTYDELHTITASGEWAAHKSLPEVSRYPGNYYYESSSPGASLTISIDKDRAEAAKHVKGLYVYYAKGLNMGSFSVAASGRALTEIDCANETADNCARTSYIELPHTSGDKIEFQILNNSDKPVHITGIAYAEDPQSVTVNNYSRTSMKLIDLDDDLLRQLCKANVVVMALGYNDARYKTVAPAADHAKFTNKINIIIESVQATGAKLAVVDTVCWNEAEGREFYRSEQKRAAQECGGVFIELAELYKKHPDMIADGAHPTVAGHHLIARHICEILKLPIL